MKNKRILGKSLGFLLALAISSGGCAQTISVLEQVGQAHTRKTYLIMTSPHPEEWNSTDWIIWRDSQGGG